MEICTGCGGTGFDGNCPVCGGSGMVGQEAPELGFGNITGCYYSTLKGSTSTKSAAIESERIAKKKLPKPKPKPNPLYQIDLPKLEFESAPTGRLVTNKPSRRKKSVKTIPHVSQKAQKPKMKSSARKGESVRIPKTESRKDGAKTRVRGRDDPRPPSHHSVHMNIWAEGFGPRASDYVSEKEKGPAPQPRGVPKKGGRPKNGYGRGAPPDYPSESAMELAFSKAKGQEVEPDGSRGYSGIREYGSGQFGSHPSFDPSDDYDE